MVIATAMICIVLIGDAESVSRGSVFTGIEPLVSFCLGGCCPYGALQASRSLASPRRGRPARCDITATPGTARATPRP